MLNINNEILFIITLNNLIIIFYQFYGKLGLDTLLLKKIKRILLLKILIIKLMNLTVFEFMQGNLLFYLINTIRYIYHKILELFIFKHF